MSVYLSLDPVSAAVFTTLNVSAVTTLAPGGVCDDVAQSTGYPFVLYEVAERFVGGMGMKPGTAGRLMEVDLRLHVFSQYQGFIEAQQVMAAAIQLLADPPTVTGYSSWAITHDETIPIGDSIVAGLKVKELVGLFRLYVQES